MYRPLLLSALLLSLVALANPPSARASVGGSLSSVIAALDEHDVTVAAAAGGPTVTRNEPVEISAGGSGQVTLSIEMPAGAPVPGDPECDPSYPQLCIPHDAEDLDCDEMGVAGFVVLAPDRHVLDEDGDGLGCED